MTPPNTTGAQALSDEQIIERCKAAGIKWIAPDLENDPPSEGGFPGSFDMVTMAEMRNLLAGREQAVAVAAIRGHNAGCESQCEQRQQNGTASCPYTQYGRLCPDCPRDWLLDAAIASTKGETS